ncbi:MAG: DNA-binding transcriptional regulator [Syntrophobacterales bacterium]|nr:DNA-binding transcriptional regulator [Syntrophobacterales bacterium]
MKKGHDSILSVVYETAKDLRNAGIMDEITMREFDALCLPPVKTYQAQEIRQIRLRYHVSQAVFATYLNVSKTSVASWESGGKKPGPTAVKLLNLVDRKGIEAVA